MNFPPGKGASDRPNGTETESESERESERER